MGPTRPERFPVWEANQRRVFWLMTELNVLACERCSYNTRDNMQGVPKVRSSTL